MEKFLHQFFDYTEKDLYKVVKKDDEGSKFDSLIMHTWTRAEENNVLRYKLDLSRSKCLEGKYEFFVQLNRDRGQKRRRPQDMQSMSLPFNAHSFNFTKISSEEILFNIGAEGDGNVIAVNDSPLESRHCLFLPRRLQGLPQVATHDSLRTVIDVVLLSKSSDIRAVFNSLCAQASVNHLHWHLYYLSREMLLETIELAEVSPQLHALQDYPAPGFCLKLSTFAGDLKSFCTVGFKIVDYLQKSDTAHNVFVTRAKSSKNLEDHDDLRMYIWARKSTYGIKDTMAFRPASCEFFGHLSLRDEDSYTDLTQEKVAEILTEAVGDVFTRVLNDIVQLTQNKLEN